MLPVLYEGRFVEEAENVLAFGLPGRGKSHCLCAVGHELVDRGYAVLFVPAFKLVEDLLAAKRELTSADVVLPTGDGKEIRLRCVVRPDPQQSQLLARLGVDVPTRLRARHMPEM